MLLYLFFFVVAIHLTFQGGIGGCYFFFSFFFLFLPFYRGTFANPTNDNSYNN